MYLLYFIYFLIRNRKSATSLFRILALYYRFVRNPFALVFTTCALGRLVICLPNKLHYRGPFAVVVSCFLTTGCIVFEGHKRAQELTAYLFGEACITLWNNVKAALNLSDKDKTFDQAIYALAVALTVSFFICGVR